MGDGRRLIGLVPGTAWPVANGAHLSVELGAAALYLRARNGVAARGAESDGEEGESRDRSERRRMFEGWPSETSHGAARQRSRKRRACHGGLVGARRWDAVALDTERAAR